jgi:hypothetical protein
MKEDANNYHPITLVPTLSNILEKVIAYQLIYFLTKNTILNKSEFRKIHPQKMVLPQLSKI